MQGDAKDVDLDKEARECEFPEEFKCKEIEGQEVERIRTVRSPTEPSKAEREKHDLHHCNYRSWCDACVRGRARDDRIRPPHVRSATQLDSMLRGEGVRPPPSSS